MMYMKDYIGFFIVCIFCQIGCKASKDTIIRDVKNPDSFNKKWELIFIEDFTSEDSLNKRWNFQNGPSKHILSSRWRENAVIDNGILKILNKKESKGGQEFTTASLSTKQYFKYGYFECRYKIGGSTGLNNSFWLMNRAPDDVIFEIDINEGQYPNKVSSNIHRHKPLPMASNGESFLYGPSNKPDLEIVLNVPVVSDKIRVIAKDPMRVSILEIKVFPVLSAGYPSVFDVKRNPNNIALKGTAIASSIFRPEFDAQNVIDNNLTSRWVSSNNMPSDVTINLDKEYEIGAIQMLSGYGSLFKNTMNDYDIQYWDGKKWINISFDKPNVKIADLSQEYHIYALEWNEHELIWYMDGKEIRREPNEFSKTVSPVILSSAVIKASAGSTNNVDGTSMNVDYVKVYKLKPSSK